MSPQKAQSFQTPETLQQIQRLTQLSNVPLVRITAAAIIRYQLWIMGSLFVVALIFNILNPTPWLTIERVAAIEFFSAVSQSLAALLGVLIVFLTVSSQLISQRRLDEYRALQTQVEQLIYLTQALPPELNAFDETLIEVINYLVPLQMKDFPVKSSLIKDEQTVILGNLLAEFRQVWAKKQKQLPFVARLHLQQILLVLNNTNEILEEFLMLYNCIAEIGRFILAIVRLSFLLGVSLLFLLLFGIIELQNSFPDLSLPIIITLAVWVLISLLELVDNAWFVYRNFYGPLSHSIRHWYF